MLPGEVGSFDVVTLAVGSMPMMRVRACVVVRRVLVGRAGVSNTAPPISNAARAFSSFSSMGLHRHVVGHRKARASAHHPGGSHDPDDR